jgi:hypothetical protein
MANSWRESIFSFAIYFSKLSSHDICQVNFGKLLEFLKLVVHTMCSLPRAVSWYCVGDVCRYSTPLYILARLGVLARVPVINSEKLILNLSEKKPESEQ